MLSLKDFCPKNNMNADVDSKKNDIKLHPPVKRCRLPRPIKRFLQPQIAVTKDLHWSKVPYNSSLFQAFRSWGQGSLRASSPFRGYREKKMRERDARGDAKVGGRGEKEEFATIILAFDRRKKGKEKSAKGGGGGIGWKNSLYLFLGRDVLSDLH